MCFQTLFIYVKGKVLFGKTALNCSPNSIQPLTFFIRPCLLFAAEFSAPWLATALLSCLVGKVLDEQILHGEACIDVHALHGDSLHALVLIKMKQNG